MTQRAYPILRDLHLYAGLFFTPFVVVFAVSVVILVHAWPAAGTKADTRRVANLEIPENLEQLKAREQVQAARQLLEALDVHGEVGYIRQLPRERRLVMPVSLPGRETVVDVDLRSRTATISVRETGFWDAMVFLHKMPGPHNVAIRGNAGFMRPWAWLADATAYAMLFVSASGVYLWTVLKAERRVGVTLLLTGATTFSVLVVALVY